MTMHINNFRLYSTSSSDMIIPKRGYGITILVEGNQIGSTYFNKLPITIKPIFCHAPKIQRVFNKVLTTDIKTLKSNYGKGTQLIYDPNKLKNKTFVYDITPYIYYLKEKLSVMRYIGVSLNFMENMVTNLRKSENQQILIYYVDPSIIEDGISIKSLYIYNFLFKLRMKIFNFPYDKIFIYAANKKQCRLIYDKSLDNKNVYAMFAKFVYAALQEKHIRMDKEDEAVIKEPEKKPEKIPQKMSSIQSKRISKEVKPVPEKDPEPTVVTQVTKKSILGNLYSRKPKVVDKVAIVDKDGVNTKVTKAVIPVAKEDPIKKANSKKDDFSVSQSQVNAAISDIVKNAKSVFSFFNIPARTIANRLSALTRSNPVAAMTAVKSFEDQNVKDQVNIANAAITKDTNTYSALAAPEPTEDIEKQEVIANELGYDTEESIDTVNDNKVISKLLKNEVALALARRHNYQEKIVKDIKDAVTPQLAEINYRVSKVWFAETKAPETEIYESDFDVINIKCIDASGKSVILKFRVPSIHEDRYVVSGGLKWFFPTIMATLPIFIVKKFHSQIRTNYSSISFFYSVFNKREDVRCFVGGYKIPLALLLTIVMGLEGMLRNMDIKYEVSPTRKVGRGKISFPLKDGKYLVIENTETKGLKKCIINGLILMFRRYTFSDIASSQEAFNCLRFYTGEPKSEYVLRQTIKYLIDVQTLNVLRANRLPTTLKTVIPYCAELAISGKVSDR